MSGLPFLPCQPVGTVLVLYSCRKCYLECRVPHSFDHALRATVPQGLLFGRQSVRPWWHAT